MASSEHTIRIKAAVDLAGPLAAELRRAGEELIAAAESLEQPRADTAQPRYGSVEEARAAIKAGDMVRTVRGRIFKTLPPNHRKHLGHICTVIRDDGDNHVSFLVECNDTGCASAQLWYTWDEVEKV